VVDDADWVACGLPRADCGFNQGAPHQLTHHVPPSTQISFGITKPLMIGEPSLDPLENTIDTELK
jgi:hypothetical protein